LRGGEDPNIGNFIDGSVLTLRSPAAGAPPRATYRIQFNRAFTFRDGEAVVPYLARLGISDLYASPYLQASPGSVHGYDIYSHERLNPEIGTAEEHARMAAALHEHGMGHLIDIVPNHMGVGGPGNRWWGDVLENGRSSAYARFFDIDWEPLKPELSGKVLLPILGKQFGDALESGELRLAYGDGRFRVEYFEHRLPIAPRSAGAVLRATLRSKGRALADDHPDRLELESIVTALKHLPPRNRTDAASVAERRREKAVTERRLAALHGASAAVRSALETAVRRFNGRPGDPRSFDALDALLDDQAYRLAFWRVAAEEINFRRFFDINDLAGVRVEEPEVFDATHRLILRLVEEKKVSGLRIDHPDGLFDPRGYLRRLQAETERRGARAPFYILVEKILTGDEPLPEEWPVAGTVGYEFLNRAGGVFVAADNEEAMDAVYRRFVPRAPDFADLVYAKKQLILRTALVSELNVLSYLLNRLSEANRRVRDFTLGSLRDALRETVACFPVYRTYIGAARGIVSERDRGYVERAVREAKRRNRGTSSLVFDFVRSILLLEWPDTLDEEARREHGRFVMKFQQLTGPVMAKGVEDTSFYLFNRLVSLNEVGGEPERFGTPVAEWHRWISERRERWPHAMNASSTHDTKRSEDVRARIHVLSEIPELWGEHAHRWTEINALHRGHEEGHPVPDANDEYLLYQTVLGAWPLGQMDDEEHAAFVGRIQAYMEKATREAKTHTSWINPNPAYDDGLREFVARILQRGGANPFLDDLLRLQSIVARFGMLNALGQTLVKLAAPGVPDVYQGQEAWDFSLVDPDNRRPVDFAARERMLDELLRRSGEGDLAALAAELVREWPDGRAKMWLTHRALRLRAEHPALFAEGAYRPLETAGAGAGHLLAFARTHGREVAVAVVPRLPATLMRGRGWTLPDAAAWGDTRVEGVGIASDGPLHNALTGEDVTPDADGGMPAALLFATFPVALLLGSGVSDHRDRGTLR
jgi:(1->4)-alpha-D-glucan 1-alpha-D-glucosylmutase